MGEVNILTLLAAVGGPSSVLGLVWWLRGQFSDMHLKFVNAIHDHEREDDKRFNHLELRMQVVEMNSDREGHKVPGYPKPFVEQLTRDSGLG